MLLLLALACSDSDGDSDGPPATTGVDTDVTDTGDPGDTDDTDADTDDTDTDTDPPVPCVDDANEDNDDFNAAVPVVSGPLMVLEHDPDFWTFTVEPGEAKRIALTFEHQDGNVDLTVYDALYLAIGTSYSFSDDEAVEINNPSAVAVEARARVLLRDPGCNTYTIEVTDL